MFYKNNCLNKTAVMHHRHYVKLINKKINVNCKLHFSQNKTWACYGYGNEAYQHVKMIYDLDIYQLRQSKRLFRHVWHAEAHIKWRTC